MVCALWKGRDRSEENEQTRAVDKGKGLVGGKELGVMDHQDSWQLGNKSWSKILSRVDTGKKTKILLKVTEYFEAEL